MKYASIAVLMVVFAACSGQDKKITELPNQTDSVSYAIGLNIGKDLRSSDVEVNPVALLQGLKDGIAADSALLTDEQIQGVMTTLQQDMMTKQQDKAKKQGEENLSVGEKFLAENKNKPGVTTTASGLQYKVIKEGTGAIPKATDNVTVHYRGTLLDGKEFDSSFKRGQPASFPVNGVIAGWTEALQLMKVGSKWEVYIPSDLAYGANGAGGDIGPNATLIFEVELLDSKPGH